MIYLTSAADNPHLEEVRNALIEVGVPVFDPRRNDAGDLEPFVNPQPMHEWTWKGFKGALGDNATKADVVRRVRGLERCHSMVGVLPMGPNADVEMGFFYGMMSSLDRFKPGTVLPEVFVYVPVGVDETLYTFLAAATGVTMSLEALVERVLQRHLAFAAMRVEREAESIRAEAARLKIIN